MLDNLFARIDLNNKKQLLEDHLMEVENKCIEKIGKLGTCLGILHDIGKVSKKFRSANE